MIEQLGPYQLLRKIGSGGMADIFLAKGPRGICVVKRPHALLTQNPDFARMFLDEASILAQVHHSGVAQIFDLGQVNGSYFLAMEYVPGFDLMTLSLEHERMGEQIPAELCAKIVADAAAGLHAAHEAMGKTGEPLNVVHRDISPHNILLSRTGEVKIIDFGVAKATNSLHRTEAGLVKGKYPYMPPEQILGLAIDRRVDVYALGLVLFELLTNVRAIGGATAVEQIENARAANILPIERFRPNVPEALKIILASCLQPSREKRYPTALHVKNDLEKFLQLTGQPLGREDLLRVFRVVAAESGHDSFPDEQMRSTEIELPSMEESVAVGIAPTRQSIKIAVPEAVENATAAALTIEVANAPIVANAPTRLLKESDVHQKVQQKSPALPWVLLGICALVMSFMAFQLMHRPPPEPNIENPKAESFQFVGVEAKLPPVQPLVPVLIAPPDASVLVSSPPADSLRNVEQDLSTIDIQSDLVCDMYLDGKPVGSTPKVLTVGPGHRTLLLVNKSSYFRKTIKLDLPRGMVQRFRLSPMKGSLKMHVYPFALVSIEGERLGKSAFSEKSIELYEGTYWVEFKLESPELKLPKVKKVKVFIEAHKETVLEMNLME
jgi:Protein kinase domain